MLLTFYLNENVRKDALISDATRLTSDLLTSYLGRSIVANIIELDDYTTDEKGRKLVIYCEEITKYIGRDIISLNQLDKNIKSLLYPRLRKVDFKGVNQEILVECTSNPENTMMILKDIRKWCVGNNFNYDSFNRLNDCKLKVLVRSFPDNIKSAEDLSNYDEKLKHNIISCLSLLGGVKITVRKV